MGEIRKAAEIASASGAGCVHTLRHPILIKHHSEKFPAAFLIEIGMIGHQIKAGKAETGGLSSDQVQEIFSNAPVPPGLLHKEGAQIGSQIRPVVEIVGDEAGPGNDLMLFI